MFFLDDNLNDKYQKEFNSVKESVIVFKLELFQGISGLMFGFFLGLSLNLKIGSFGIVIVAIFVLLMIISFIQPALLRLIFFFGGLMVGIFLYLLLNIVDFIPAFP